MMVQQLLSNTSSFTPDAVCIRHEGVSVTYRELEQLSDALAAHIQDKWSIARGDRVCVMYENSPAHIVAYFAILKAGATVVSLNAAETPGKIKGMIEHSEAQGLLGSAAIWKRIAQTVGIPKGLEYAIDYRESLNLLSEGKPEETSCRIDADRRPIDPRGIDLDLAEIVYTSGSTSKPKGVMLTHLNLATNMASIVDYFELSADDSIVVILPFSYIYGKSLLLTHVKVGGKIIIDNRFTYPQLILETIEKEEATGFAGVPSTYAILMAKTSIASSRTPRLRYVAQAGGAMAPALQQQVIEAVAPARLIVMYGATEAAPRLTWLPPDRLQDKLGSIGIPLKNVEMGIRGPDGNMLASGEEGELVARGSNIMKGYWKDPEGTQMVLRDGYYHTGDIGYRDKEGFYFITGRKSDFVKVKGIRISCKEVEECLLELDDIQETAVIGSSDDVFGEAIKAYIVPKSIDSKDTRERIAKHVGQRIGATKIPQKWDFRDTLPKNSSGKIMKEVLKKEMK